MSQAVKRDFTPAPRARWAAADWLEFGAEMLRREGATGVTLERLCSASGRTKGSFYHHFESMGAFLVALAGLWLESETREITRQIRTISTPGDALSELARRSAGLDTRLEAGIRALATSNHPVKQVMDQADSERERTIADLLSRAYRLDPARSLAAARLFHGLHLAALVRSPGDIAAFSAGPARQLVRWLEGEASSADSKGTE